MWPHKQSLWDSWVLPTKGVGVRSRPESLVRPTTNGTVTCNVLEVSSNSQKWLPLVHMVTIQEAAHIQGTHPSINLSCCMSLNTEPTSRFPRLLVSWLQLEKVGQVSEAGETTTFRNKSTSSFWSVNFPLPLFLHKAYSFAYKRKKI